MYFGIEECPETHAYNLHGHPDIGNGDFVYDASSYGEPTKVKVDIRDSINEIRDKFRLFLDYYFGSAEDTIDRIGDIPVLSRIMKDLAEQDRKIRAKYTDPYAITQEDRIQLNSIRESRSNARSMMENTATIRIAPYSHFVDIICLELTERLQRLEPDLKALGYSIDPILYSALEEGPSHEAAHHMRSSMPKDNYYEMIRKNIESYSLNIIELKSKIAVCEDDKELKSLKEELDMAESGLRSSEKSLRSSSGSYSRHKSMYVTGLGKENRDMVIIDLFFSDYKLTANFNVTPIPEGDPEDYVKTLIAPIDPSEGDIAHAVYYILEKYKTEWDLVQDMLARINVAELMGEDFSETELISRIRDMHYGDEFYHNILRPKLFEAMRRDTNLKNDILKIIQLGFPKDMGLTPDYILDHPEQYPGLYKTLIE